MKIFMCEKAVSTGIITPISIIRNVFDLEVCLDRSMAKNSELRFFIDTASVKTKLSTDDIKTIINQEERKSDECVAQCDRHQ